MRRCEAVAPHRFPRGRRPQRSAISQPVDGTRLAPRAPMNTRVLVVAFAVLLAGCGRSVLGSDGGFNGSGGGSAGGGTGGTGGSAGGVGGGTGGAGGGAQSACSTLNREGCQARSDCLTSMCFLCSCTPVFNQCRAAGESELSCPAVGCASPSCCGKQSECSGAQSCAPPGTPTGCGTCMSDTSSCAIDADCSPSTTGMICKPVQCSCNASVSCQPGCTKNGDCSIDGDVCNTATHRCGAPTCSASSPCPSYFDCVQGSCQRKMCTTDANCPLAYCVSGGCYGGKGTCQYPVP